MAHSKDYRDTRNKRTKYPDTKIKTGDYRDEKYKTRDYGEEKYKTGDYRDEKYKTRDYREENYKTRDCRDENYKTRDYREEKYKTRDNQESKKNSNHRYRENKATEHPDRSHKKRMKLRTQRPSEFSLQRSNEPSSPDTQGSYPEEEEPRGRCKMEDAKTKFSTFFFGLLLMAGGAALLYFGFRPSPATETGKTSRDNKLLLTCGFICSMLGMFCFVVSILMFKDVACLYNDNLYKVDENENV